MAGLGHGWARQLAQSGRLGWQGWPSGRHGAQASLARLVAGGGATWQARLGGSRFGPVYGPRQAETVQARQGGHDDAVKRGRRR